MTPVQHSLVDKARRSLQAAESLKDQGFYDFAVSRTYYAMFYVAEALLDQAGFSFSSHAGVISAFGQHLARPGKIPVEYHRYLIDAQSQRTRADYELDVNLTQEDAETLIYQTQSLLEIGTRTLLAEKN